MRVDTAFNKLWELKLGISIPVTPFYQMKQLSDGNFLAIGDNVDSVDAPDNPFQAGYLVKVTPQGQVLWERDYFNVKVYNFLYDFVELDNGDIVACGQALTDSNAYNAQQGWLLRLNSNGCLNSSCTPNSIQDFSDKFSCQVFPNPVLSDFTLTIGRPIEKDRSILFTLFDLTGRIILHQFIADQRTIFQKDNLTDGLYLWQISDGDNYLTGGKISFR